jgi:hypothetical protein
MADEKKLSGPDFGQGVSLTELTGSPPAPLSLRRPRIPSHSLLNLNPLFARKW